MAHQETYADKMAALQEEWDGIDSIIAAMMIGITEAEGRISDQPSYVGNNSVLASECVCGSNAENNKKEKIQLVKPVFPGTSILEKIANSNNCTAEFGLIENDQNSRFSAKDYGNTDSKKENILATAAKGSDSNTADVFEKCTCMSGTRFKHPIDSCSQSDAYYKFCTRLATESNYHINDTAERKIHYLAEGDADIGYSYSTHKHTTMAENHTEPQLLYNLKNANFNTMDDIKNFNLCAIDRSASLRRSESEPIGRLNRGRAPWYRRNGSQGGDDTFLIILPIMQISIVVFCR